MKYLFILLLIAFHPVLAFAGYGVPITSDSIIETLGYTPINNTNGTGTGNVLTNTTLAGQGTVTATLNANGYNISPTEVGYLDGVVDNIQTLIDGKQTSLGYTPIANTNGSVTTALGYTPVANTSGSITTALGYTPVGNPGSINNKSICGSTTAFVLSADSVTLRDADNKLVTINDPIDTTCTTETFGVNGRDISGSFGTDVWVYFYWIWNGSSLNSVCSTNYKTAGGSGMILPSGYTHWCLAGIVRRTSSALVFGYQNGNTYFLQNTGTAIVSDDQSLTETTQDFSNNTPPECVNYTVLVTAGITNDIAVATAKYNIRLATTKTYYQQYVQTQAPTLVNWASGICIIPNINSSFITIWTSTGNNSVGAWIYLLSYSIPN